MVRRMAGAFRQLLGSNTHTTLLGAVSSAFEWYDYALFGYFASIIAGQFFPDIDPMAALLSSFAVFASGFAMRPLGALLFGYIGDRVSRKASLRLSLILMAIPTTLLGCLPTYAYWGIYSTICLVLIRLLQGLAVGGNYSGSFILTIEHAPSHLKTFAGSLAMFGVLGGLFLGSAVAALLAWLMPHDFLVQFGWRIPFLFGFGSAILASLVRRFVPDICEPSDHHPLRDITKNHLSSLAKAIGIILLDGVGVYILFVFMTTYATTFLHLESSSVLLINTLTMASLVLIIPFAGFLGDQYGAAALLKKVSLGFLFLSLPLFFWLSTWPSLTALFVLQSIFAILVGAAYGTLPMTIVSIFPHFVRYTACGLAFNISVAVFGGTAPFVVTSLIHSTQWLIIPGLILSLVGGISYGCLCSLKKKNG